MCGVAGFPPFTVVSVSASGPVGVDLVSRSVSFWQAHFWWW